MRTIEIMNKYVMGLCLFFSTSCVLSSGLLDTAFGSRGEVSFLVPGVTGNCMAQGISLTPDNCLMVGGSASVRGNKGIALVKYQINGSLASSFGNGGTVLLDPSTPPLSAITSGVTCDWDVAGVQVHPLTGKVIVASLITMKGRSVGLGLASFNADGSSDNSFGTFAPGSTTVRTGFLGMNGMYPYALAVQPDGKIITAGSSGGDTQGNNVFTLVRHSANGMVDKSFGANGVVKFSPFPLGRGIQERIYSVALQRDGKIVTAGIVTAGSVFAMVMCRFNSNGSIDLTFGQRGYVVATPGGLGLDIAFGVAVQDDQKIVVSGYSKVPVSPTAANNRSTTNLNLVVLRYNQNGSIDTTFGYAGMNKVKVGEWGMMPFAVAVQSDRKIVTVGRSTSYDQQGNFDERFAVVRFTSRGRLDTSFGPDRRGIVQTTLFDGQAMANGLVVYGNKIAVSGYAMDNARGFYTGAVVQYNQ